MGVRDGRRPPLPGTQLAVFPAGGAVPDSAERRRDYWPAKRNLGAKHAKALVQDAASALGSDARQPLPKPLVNLNPGY